MQPHPHILRTCESRFSLTRITRLTVVARTTQAIEACAKRRNIPLLSVHAGPETRLVHDGSIVRLDLKRSKLCSFRLGLGQRFDISMWRHLGRVADTVKWFAPDVLHFTGPSDVGQLGACLGHRLRIPMVASWHTNLHDTPRAGCGSIGQVRRSGMKRKRGLNSRRFAC